MNSLSDINTATIEGKALMAALAIITTVLELMEGVNHMYPSGHEQWKKTGIQLVAEERHEQIVKHGFTLEDDYGVNQEQQLLDAAIAMIDGGTQRRMQVPSDWDQRMWIKMLDKPLKQRLIMAAAMLSAHVDIMLADEEVQLGLEPQPK